MIRFGVQHPDETSKVYSFVQLGLKQYRRTLPWEMREFYSITTALSVLPDVNAKNTFWLGYIMFFVKPAHKSTAASIETNCCYTSSRLKHCQSSLRLSTWWCIIGQSSTWSSGASSWNARIHCCLLTCKHPTARRLVWLIGTWCRNESSGECSRRSNRPAVGYRHSMLVFVHKAVISNSCSDVSCRMFHDGIKHVNSVTFPTSYCCKLSAIRLAYLTR